MRATAQQKTHIPKALVLSGNVIVVLTLFSGGSSAERHQVSQGIRSSPLGSRWLVVRSDVHFKAPATAGEELVITTRVAEIKGARMLWQQRIERSGSLIVEADIHAACIGRTGRPARVPDALRETLATLS